MKKFMKSLLCLFLSLICLCAVGAMASCGEETEKGVGAEVLANDSKTFVFRADEDADGSKSMYDFLNAYAEEGVITIEGSNSDYGFFVTAVNGTKQADDYSTYWSVYTTLTTKDDVSYSNEEYGTYDLNGTKLISASYGVSGLPVYAGEIYALVFVGAQGS